MTFGTIRLHVARRPAAYQLMGALLLLLSHVLALPQTDQQLPQKEKDAEVIDLQELYKYLREQSKDMVDVQMALMCAAAVDGDEFYHLKQSVSPQCRRVVRAAMKMYSNLVLQQQVDVLIDEAIGAAFDSIKEAAAQLGHPLEYLCVEIEKEFAQNANLSSAYTRAKETVAVAGAADGGGRHYFNTIFKTDKDLIGAYVRFFQQDGFARMTMMKEFGNQANASTAYNSTYNLLARAIIEVARKEEYRQKVENVQEKVFVEVGAIIASYKNIFDNFLDDSNTFGFTLTMMDKFEKYFDEDADLKRELDSAKRKIESQG